jgi:fatty-acyl-CoA synthase
VPVYPPLYLGSLHSYSRHTAGILRSSSAVHLIASRRLVNILWALVDQVPSLSRVVATEELDDLGDGDPDYPALSPDDTVFLQYTSGSTTDPRGVIVTHRSLLANVEGIMCFGLDMDPGRDRGVTWLPLYHDMGLVGFVLGPVAWGVSVVFIPTLRFVKNASVWMETIHRHRATVSFAPNFAFALAVRRTRSTDLERWDLSCVKVLGCGAEPIHASTMRKFNQLFGERCRLRPEAVLPAYGLAEATLAVTMKPLPEGMRVRRVDRARFHRDGVACDADGEQASEEHVSCGHAFPGHEIVIVDDRGTPLPEGREGEIHLRGPSLAAGYYGNPAASAETWRDGWLRTGDLGYLYRGELYVTGRIKDLIILNGRNLHPQVVEWITSEVRGVRKGGVVAFSRPGDAGEELVIAVETNRRQVESMVAEIEDAVQRAIFTKPVEIVWLSPGSLPKTSSGKLQRYQVRQLYMRGELAWRPRRRGSGLDRIAVVRYLLRSLRARAKSYFTRP